MPINDIPVTFSSICLATFLSVPVPCFNDSGTQQLMLVAPVNRSLFICTVFICRTGSLCSCLAAGGKLQMQFCHKVQLAYRIYNHIVSPIELCDYHRLENVWNVTRILSSSYCTSNVQLICINKFIANKLISFINSVAYVLVLPEDGYK